jgi:hypothetical protein
VEEARRPFRRHRRNPTELAWQEYLEANKVKGAAIRQAKRKSFEEAIESACKEGEKSFWRLAKWATSKSFFPPTPPSIPFLTTSQGPATTLEIKCDALKARFFPPILFADLSDIPEFQYLLQSPHPLQSHLKKLHLPSPKHARTKPQAQMAYLCIFSSFWAGRFLNTYSPCSKPVSIFLTTPFISSNHLLLP